jgi:hypothetical protein
MSMEDANPETEGTPQSFGGTSGSIESPDPRTLPNVETNVKTNVKTNVLNKNSLFSIKDYGIIQKGLEAKKLQEFSSGANEQLKKMAMEQRFYNLSLKDIITNTARTMISVFTEILELKNGLGFQEKANQIALILLKGNRLIYVGVFFVLISFLFMLIFLSS